MITGRNQEGRMVPKDSFIRSFSLTSVSMVKEMSFLKVALIPYSDQTRNDLAYSSTRGTQRSFISEATTVCLP
jgi:hypothetical protein